MTKPFQDIEPQIIGNDLIREPQREAFLALLESAQKSVESEREVGIVLPVGCGKSGTITLTPFAYKSFRTLVIAPGLSIADQLAKEFDPANPKMFYKKCKVLLSPPFPEPVEIRGDTTNHADLVEADIVITNIHQLQGEDNRWIQKLPNDFFDLIIFDEGHHSVAATWEALKECFPSAKIVNFSATPLRADGQVMAGKVIYSFPISKAIKAGFVKRLKAVQLNPKTLRYVRRGESEEIEVSLQEVIKLGEEEADFRRSIVTSEETLATITDASIQELYRLKDETGENRLKIIASALNFEHCRQIVEAYSTRGLRADYVHSKQDGAANKKVMALLESHELDVIVQVRKLGEGFDHPYLSVAAVFSVFSSLSPFVQFVGRVMRVIVQNAPMDPKNQGVVVFHAGANIASKWQDFQQYSSADQEYFDQLLPLEFVDPTSVKLSREIFPTLEEGDPLEVRSQSEISLEELELLAPDENLAIQLLKERGLIPASFNPANEILEQIPTTKVAKRQAMRASLNMRVRNEAAKLLHRHGIRPGGSELDRLRRGRANIILLISEINTEVNKLVGKESGSRSELSQGELDNIDLNFSSIVEGAWSKLKNGN
ncbi:DEAD/DEAH box helicase family protein [Pseudomonas syringae]|uniref:DEAD/DEAH box helicase n=1 Tax=Pseudomonas syringae TaxID=317 RepID=UPI00200ABD6D|nr:DEAD/DEAH box helicase family protein [Pseudomonas syringae]MCK9751729.1 DEAD/DEAH box helicase family protein [Pseudomonas syringae pv. syringae]MDU8603762.1 DEAD/DEAH box helicase family protein [Pseudomonas syringae]